MLKKINNHIAAVSALAITTVGSTVNAVAINAPTGSLSDLGTLIQRISNVILGIAAFLVLIYLIMGGFNYLTSAGNQEKVTNAKNMILYAIVGIIIIGIAFPLTTYVLNIIFAGTVKPAL